MSKPTVLVYSVIRNESKYIDRYYDQVKEMVSTFPKYNFILSLYENDSTDDTVEKIRSKDWSFLKNFSFITEKLMTNNYGSVKSKDRVRNLSIARNKALEVPGFLDSADYVMMIESDMRFDMNTIKQILEFEKLEPDFDIVSGLTVNNHPIYDSWATRKGPRFTSHEEVRLFDITSKPYDKYYATSNGVCLYRAQPFKDGVRYGYINPVTNKFDCDTVVVCQNFHLSGFDNIYIIHTAKIYHEDF